MADVAGEFRKSRVVFFDFDGVIADSFEQVLKIWRDVCRSIQLPRERWPDETTLRNLEPMSIAGAAAAVGVEERAIPQFRFEFSRQFNATELPNVFKGMPDVIRQVSADSILVIVSSSTTERINAVLDREELRTCFRAVLGHDPDRPKHEQIKDWLDDNEYGLARHVMIGDSRSDLAAAATAGISAIAVTWGYQTKADLVERNPCYCAHTPASLKHFLLQRDI